MAIQYLTMDRNKSMGNEMLSVVETLRSYVDKLRQLKEIMDNMTDGVSYTAIETQFGVPTGKGVTLYNLTAGAVSELAADTSFNQVVDWTVPLS